MAGLEPALGWSIPRRKLLITHFHPARQIHTSAANGIQYKNCEKKKKHKANKQRQQQKNERETRKTGSERERGRKGIGKRERKRGGGAGKRLPAC